MVATFVVSLGLTVKEGLITGVSLSILKLTYEVAMPNLAVCGQVEDGTFRDVRYLARKRNRGGILHVDIEYTYAYIYIYIRIYCKTGSNPCRNPNNLPDPADTAS